MIDGKPMQRIAEHCDIEVPLIDLQAINENVRDTEARRLIDEAICQPFDLSKDCVLRTLLLRLSGQEHIFVVVKHHIASDGWSSAVWREFQSLVHRFHLRRVGRTSGITDSIRGLCVMATRLAAGRDLREPTILLENTIERFERTATLFRQAST